MNTCQHCGMPSVAGHVCASGGQLKIVYGVVPDPRDAEIAALRAELERKDAALKAERQCAENFAEQFAECQWIDMGGYFEVRGPVTLMLDSEFAEQAYTARRRRPPAQGATMQSLIEQVKRLAEAKAHYARTGSSILFDDLARDKIDFPALLAHMQAQQAVCDAARELVAAEEDGLKFACAALENLRSDNDGK